MINGEIHLMKGRNDMITYCPMAKIKPKYEGDPMDTLFTNDSCLSFMTAVAAFSVWKSSGYDMIEAWIDMYDGDEKVKTFPIDLSKV